MKINSKKKWLLCTFSILTLTASAHADPFGIPGSDGGFGGNGIDGANGRTMTITANGQSQILDLRGGDGGPGGNGMPGSPAQACFMTDTDDLGSRGIRDDFFGANGGRGGDAGRGGNGGNGGDVTIYYTDQSALRKILVNAAPGTGNQAGLPGAGAPGCACPIHRWLIPVKVCTEVVTPAPQPQPQPQPAQPTPAPAVTNVVCNIVMEPHVCSDGYFGRDGSPASNGVSGRYGRLTLINNPGPLTATNPSGALTVGNLPANTTLTIDTWATAQGAASLLAPGSQLQDTYDYYSGRRSVPVSLVWNARQPQSMFEGQEVSVSTDAEGQVSASASPEMWAEMGISYNNSAATISVNKAVQASQATQLTDAHIYGWGNGTIVQFADGANVNDLVNTSIHAKVISSGIFDHTRYDDEVPVNLIVTNGAYIQVQIGKLQGIPSGDLAKGKDLKVELTITRSLGGRSATQQINLEAQKLGNN